MFKRIISSICLLLIGLILVCCNDSKPESDTQTELMTQEEFQMEFTKQLDDLMLYSSKTISNKVQMFDDTHGFRIEKYKLILHVNELAGGTKKFPIEDEIFKLYNEYSETVYNGFLEFYNWYLHEDGEDIWTTYDNGMLQASRHYKINNDPIYSEIIYSEMMAEDFYAFEDYIRENPDFTIESDSYIQLLEWLGVEIPNKEEA